MKNNYLSLAAAVVVMMVSIATMVTAQDNGKDLQAGGRLEGTWNVRVSIRNCVTGNVIRSFDSITQFVDGGTLIDSTSGTAQALKTPGQGVWEHTVDSSYRFAFKSFTFDAMNNYTGYTLIRHTATLNNQANAYESAGTLEVYNPNGVLVATGCSTTTATRFGF